MARQTGEPTDRPVRPWKTVASRISRWRIHGVFDHLLAETRRLADAAGELDWLVHLVDGSVVRRPSPSKSARVPSKIAR